MKRLASVRHAGAQWGLWVGANLVGFFWGWAIARSVALFVAESRGANLGDGGIQDLALGLGTLVGAPVFVLVHATVVSACQWPVVRTWGVSGRPPARPRLWLWLVYTVVFPASVFVHLVQNWVLGEAYPLFAEPLLLFFGGSAEVALIAWYVKRRLGTFPPIDQVALARRVAWVGVVSLGAAAWLAQARLTWLEGHAPWQSGDSCAGCGTVVTSQYGVRVAMVTGLILLWQLRPRRRG